MSPQGALGGKGMPSSPELPSESKSVAHGVNPQDPMQPKDDGSYFTNKETESLRERT